LTTVLSSKAVLSTLFCGQDILDKTEDMAILDILTGKKSVARRLPVTQYSSNHSEEVSLFEMNLHKDPLGAFLKISPDGYWLSSRKDSISNIKLMLQSEILQSLILRD